MHLTLQNYRKVLPGTLIKKAAKIKIRECDEIKKGYFQAYADESDKSFDVSLALNKAQEIMEHHCDCISGEVICRHITALLLFLSNKDKAVPRPGGRKKKASPLDILIDQTEDHRLKDWLKELLKKNKDLALAFYQQFAPDQQDFTPESIRELTLNVVTSIAGKRAKVEVNEAKKIAALWKEVHEPILKDCFVNIGDLKRIQNIEALLSTCQEICNRLRTGSSRLDKYLSELLQRLGASIHDIQLEQTWATVTDYFIQRMGKADYYLTTRYLYFLNDLIEISSPERRKGLAQRLIRWFDNTFSKQSLPRQAVVEVLFKISVESKLFKENSKLFEPLQFDNDYNIRLINQLIEAGELGRAAIYCEDQISGNFKEQFNIPYLQLLKRIHSLDGDDQSLTEVMKKLFRYSFDLDDFHFIITHMPNDVERRKWKNQAIQYAKNHVSQEKLASLFIFKLLNEEENYIRMINSINYYTPYSILPDYAEQLLKANKDLFLEKLLDKTEYFYQPENSPEAIERRATFEKLATTLRQYFSKGQLLLRISKINGVHHYSGKGNFIDFLKSYLES